jgi:tetratricopeptide (TPR) repeat protein
MSARAQVLEDLEVTTEQGFAQIRIRFPVPVRYLRHFPAAHGEQVNIYLQSLARDTPDPAQREERKRWPESALLPGFTVDYIPHPPCDIARSELCLVVQFTQPLSYTLRLGDDNRSLLLLVPLATTLAPAAPGETAHYAITLMTSFAPLGVSKARQEFPDRTIYSLRTTVFGRELFALRLGFFDSLEAATAMQEQIRKRYPAAAVLRVEESERTGALGVPLPAAPPPPPTPAPAPIMRAPSDRPIEGVQYALNLATYQTEPRALPELPLSLRQYRVYVQKRFADGKPLYLLRLGFFATEADADKARTLLAPRYPGTVVVPVSEAEMKEAQAAVTAPAAPAAPSTAAAAPGEPEAMLAEARAAIVREDYPTAIHTLTRLLALPTNPYRRDAQEYLGIAYERSGDIVAARREYEKYLQQYPEGDDATRVRQRIVNLVGVPGVAEALRAEKPKEARDVSVYGSLSQYYYRGNSKIDTQTTTANTLDSTTLSFKDQSALVTNLDLNARLRTATSDDRVVIRDSHTANFLPGQPDTNRLSAAYYEHKDKPRDWGARLGRQPGTTGGVVGRFDGATLGYGLSPKWRLNLVGGEPVEFSIDSMRRFLGTNLDFGLFAEHWSGNAYVIRQRVDEIADREALGTELRYTAPRAAVFSLIDYDTLFNTFNIGMAQGNWQLGQNNTALNALIDWRKTPTLQTSNAVLGESTSSIRTLLQTYSEEELRQRARAVTATSTLMSLGVTQPLGNVWQLGADARLTRISGTTGTNTVPPAAGTGNIWTYTVQTIATGLIAKRDVTLLSASLIDAKTYDGTSYALTTRALIGPKWTVDLSLRSYNQEDAAGTTLKRLTPILRTVYQWKERIAFEAEYGIENTHIHSATLDEKSRRNYFSLGYRWDF